jgi:hypothetical protein
VVASMLQSCCRRNARRIFGGKARLVACRSARVQRTVLSAHAEGSAIYRGACKHNSDIRRGRTAAQVRSTCYSPSNFPHFPRASRPSYYPSNFRDACCSLTARVCCLCRADAEEFQSLCELLYRGHQAWHLAHIVIKHLVPLPPSTHADLPFDLVHWIQEHDPLDLYVDIKRQTRITPFCKCIKQVALISFVIYA